MLIAHNWMRLLREPFPIQEELRIGRAFMLLEINSDDQLQVAEVLLRDTKGQGQALSLSMFIVYSTDGEALPPGETLERQVDLSKGERENWTLAKIHYY